MLKMKIPTFRVSMLSFGHSANMKSNASMPEPSKKSPQEIAERRRQVYASMRLPEIKTEIQTLRSEYRTQPRFSSITDANAKGTAVRRRAYIVGRIASLTGERDALRHERKR